jgi:flagellar basal body-associated protein FliL
VQNLPQEKPPERASLSGSQFVSLGVLLAILIVTVVWATAVWTSSNNVAMSKHGWIALGLGTFFSLLIGCGLMALMFYSSRSGHDEAATPKFMEPRERTYHDPD